MCCHPSDISLNVWKTDVQNNWLNVWILSEICVNILVLYIHRQQYRWSCFKTLQQTHFFKWRKITCTKTQNNTTNKYEENTLNNYSICSNLDGENSKETGVICYVNVHQDVTHLQHTNMTHTERLYKAYVLLTVYIHVYITPRKEGRKVEGLR